MRKKFWALLLVSIMAIMLLPAITMATEDYKNKMLFSGDDDLKVSHYQSTKGIDHSSLNRIGLIHDDVYYDRKEMPPTINKTVTTSLEGGECGKDGSNLTWKFEDGTLTILGEGEMEDYEQSGYGGPSNAPWDMLSIKHVVIQNGVTSIGRSALEGGIYIESIIIPNSVISIGSGAFFNCKSLESIEIPNCITNIGDSAFYGCTSLKSIEIPDTITTIQGSTFNGCTSLKSVIIPNSVISIGSYAFSGCKSLESIEIPDYITNIGTNAFSNCTTLETIEIPNKVTSIQHFAFSGCTSLKSINIPDSVISIGTCAFMGCTTLKSIVIPTSVASIEQSAFKNCTSLTSITIPDGVKIIHNTIFSGCTSLESIVLPESVTRIDEFAFSDCTSLESIEIPEKVTSIEKFAFRGCTSLKSIELPKTITRIAEYVFYKCTLLKSITIPDGMTCINNHTFSGCTSLESIVIPNSVKYIEETAFEYCGSLTVICSPNSYAEQFAKQHGFNIEYFEVSDVPSNSYSISLNINTLDMAIGDKAKLVASVNPPSQNVKWDSDNTDVVVVSTDGLITGVSSGSATITASIKIENDTYYSTCNVNVLDHQTDSEDNDGIPDIWEINGADFDRDGNIDLPLNLMGADPLKPDVFVEIDWMVRPARKFLFWEVTTSHSFKPNENTLEMVYDAFNKHNINLHLDAGPDSVDFVTGNKWGELSAGNEIEYSKHLVETDGKFDIFDIWNRSIDMEKVRKHVFHHCIFGDYLYNDYTDTTSGMTPSFGQYFAVTLGGWGTVNNKTIAGTFMHELGHSLGLHHGGCDDENYKPNYLSIMNYAFQTTGLPGTGNLNYSDYELPDIDESNIDEYAGLDPNGETQGTNLRTILFYRTFKQRTTKPISKQSIDFDGNGKIESGIYKDLNPNGNFDDPEISTLKSKNDWNNIVFKSGIIGSDLSEENSGLPADDNLSEMASKTLEESIETKTLANDGVGSIELIASTLVKDVSGQNLYFDVNNLGANDTTFSITIESTLLDATYKTDTYVPGSETQIESVRICVPVKAELNEDTYGVKCTVLGIGGEEQFDFTITVYEPSQEEILELQDMVKDDTNAENIDPYIFYEIKNVVEKEKEKVEISGVNASDLIIYDGTSHIGFTGTPSSKYTGEYDITYVGRNDTVYNSTSAPINAGDYTVIITIPKENTEYIGSILLDFKIKKAEQVSPIAPELSSKTSNSVILESIPANSNGATVEYSNDYGYSWQISPTFTNLKENTNYEFVVRYAETQNYNASPASESIKVTTNELPKPNSNSGGSSGGGTSNTYSITTDTTIENGSVSISPESAKQNTKVTIIVKPNAGYVLDKLSIKDKKGTKINIEKQNDSTYTFLMPSSNVTVTVSFKKEEVNTTTTNVFTDVPENAYFTDAVKWAVENGITMGTSSTTFSPYQTCTRAEIVTFLWRAAGSPENEITENLFTDVNQQSYYSDAILWAKLNAITNGTTSTTFSPDTGCTRAQVVNFLYNYAKRPTVNYTNNFKDVDSNAYYADAVRWALEQNITNGTSVDTFSPDEVCSRAQIVTFLYRYMAN